MIDVLNKLTRAGSDLANGAVRWALPSLAAIALAGCTLSSTSEAPIIERSPPAGAGSATATGPTTPPTAAPVREAREGKYTVQRGDTLYSIALNFGRDYREIAAWNGIEDPSKIRVGQILQVEPSAATAGAAPATSTTTGDNPAAVVATLPVGPVAAPETRPLGTDSSSPSGGGTGDTTAKPAAPAPAVPPPVAAVEPAPSPAAPAANAPPAATLPKPSAPAAANRTDEPAPPKGAWIWPADGKLIDKFDEPRNKGIDIGGIEGDPVVAANDGQVVYNGNSLARYGNLVIVKHTDDYLSAYAHNKQVVVEQGQQVKRGQRIAVLGKSAASSPRLHFEIRRQGKPVDPLRYLPPR